MVQEKSVFQSKTLIGIIIAALPTILGIFGVADSMEITEQTEQIVSLIVEAAGSILAIYGRISATTTVSLKR